jgi:MFS superfamily sulfate permease-like transporter
MLIMIKGLAYGALTSLNPVNGLYVSFYSGCTYILFGTSKRNLFFILFFKIIYKSKTIQIACVIK